MLPFSAIMHRQPLKETGLQTRLPGLLSAQLQSIVADYESDMTLLRAENSDSETLSQDMPDTIQCPLIFPSGQLLEALADAVKVASMIAASILAQALKIELFSAFSLSCSL